MNESTYRVRLRIRSPLGTPLVADTLFGHLCWGIAYHEGPDAVQAFIKETCGDRPPLVISDPLPADHWPMPVLPPAAEAERAADARADPPSRLADHDRNRAIQRRAWVPATVWERVAGRLDGPTLLRALAECASPPPPEPLAAAVAHNAINRFSGHTLDEHGLFHARQWYMPPDAVYEVWARTTWDPDRLRSVFEWGLVGGYGRDASTGLGQITVQDVEPATLPPKAVDRPNALVTLGACVPDISDPTEGLWTVDVRHGRLGGAWAVGHDEETSAAFKYPVVFLARGTLLLTDEYRLTVGRVVSDVHPTRREVITCGRTLALPVQLTEECLRCLRTV